MENVVVFITAPNEEEAAGIARTLVEEKLAACVNIILGIRSISASTSSSASAPSTPGKAGWRMIRKCFSS
jgi:hypothetical protein